jgi:hypothetical protein
MISTEDRLRAATRAAAATVPLGSAPPLRLPPDPGPGRAGRRRGWLRAMTPLAAAAAVAGVVIASLVLTSHTPSDRPSAPAGAARALGSVPPYYVALSNQAPPVRQAVVRATATGAVLATVNLPRPYGTFTFVSGAADDRTFVLAAQRWWAIGSGTRGVPAQQRDNWTRVAFFRLRFDPATRTTRLTRLSHLAGPPATLLAGIGVSPDGSRLALALRTLEIQVVTLATGRTRYWIRPASPHSTGIWIGNDKAAGEPLSWTADGRILAFQFWTESGGITEIRLLDTTSPGGSLRAARPAVTFVGHGQIKTGPTGNSIITPDGTRIVTVASRTPGARPRVAEFSARTGKPARFWSSGSAGTPWNVLWTDPSGSTLIISAQPTAKATEPVTGVLSGKRFTPLPGAPADVVNIAW